MKKQNDYQWVLGLAIFVGLGVLANLMFWSIFYFVG